MSILAKAREITANILDSAGVNPKQNVNTDEEWMALRKAKAWLDDDKQAKADFIDEIKEMHKAYMGDHWSLKGPTGSQIRSAETQANKPNSVDNMVFSQVEGFVAEFSNPPVFMTQPGEYSDEEDANALTELDEFIANKNKYPREQRKSVRNFFKYGTIIDQVFWDPTWQGGVGPNRWVGDVRIKSLHPDVLYIDARCKDVTEIESARRIHKVVRHPLEYFVDTFKEKGQYVEEDTGTFFQTVGDDEEDTKSRNRTAWYVETWYKGFPLLGENKGYGLHVLKWAGEVVLDHISYIYPEPIYPFVMHNLYDREGTIWGFGEVKQIISPQIVLNKEDEMILESNLHQAFGQTFYTDNGTITDKQKARIEKGGSLPGMWFPVRDVKGILRLYGNGAAPSLFTHRDAKLKSIETITGRYDTTQGRVPAGITAASAIMELNQRATNRMKAKEETLKSHYQSIGERINKFICWYYEEKRGYRILKPNNKYEFKTFSNQQIKKVHIFKDSKVIPLQDFVPGDMIEGQDYEVFVPEFDSYVKVDNEMPVSKAYYIELAKELYAAQIIDRQAVLYVIENGKLEPMEEIIQRMGQAQQAQAQAQAPQQPSIEGIIAQLPPETLQQVEGMIKQGATEEDVMGFLQQYMM